MSALDLATKDDLRAAREALTDDLAACLDEITERLRRFERTMTLLILASCIVIPFTTALISKYLIKG